MRVKRSAAALQFRDNNFESVVDENMNNIMMNDSSRQLLGGIYVISVLEILDASDSTVIESEGPSNI